MPDEAKDQLRAQLATMRHEYARNREWANVSMSVADELTDKESVAVILRHREELERALTRRAP